MSVTRWLSRVLVTPPDRISPPDLRGLPHTNSIGSPKYVRMGSYLVSDAYRGFGDNHLKKEKNIVPIRGPVVNLSPHRRWAGGGRPGATDWWLRSGGGFRACVSRS